MAQLLTDEIFKQAMKWEFEKGISNNPNDKGGPTNDGVTWAHYQENCERVLNRLPTWKHFITMTAAEIRQFYARIWDKVNCDGIENAAVAFACFDFSVNSKWGKREIQRVLLAQGYDLKADNYFGPVTIAAINDNVFEHGAASLINAIYDARERYLKSLVVGDVTQQEFEKGWFNRVRDGRTFALNLAMRLDFKRIYPNSASGFLTDNLTDKSAKIKDGNGFDGLTETPKKYGI